ncbi:MAG: PqiC family protein [Pelovirga sp.]
MRTRFFIGTILLLFCSACIQIGTPPQPVRYFLLEEIANEVDIYPDFTSTITIEVVEFPEYLTRPQVVSQGRKNRIHFSDAQRWAMPLDDNISAVVRQNLIRMLPEAQVTISPWQNLRPAQYRVELLVSRFSGEPGGLTDILIRWRIFHEDGTTVEGRLLNRELLGEDYEDLVSGLNHAIDLLSSALATALAEPED